MAQHCGRHVLRRLPCKPHHTPRHAVKFAERACAALARRVSRARTSAASQACVLVIEHVLTTASEERPQSVQLPVPGGAESWRTLQHQPPSAAARSAGARRPRRTVAPCCGSLSCGGRPGQKTRCAAAGTKAPLHPQVGGWQYSSLRHRTRASQSTPHRRATCHESSAQDVACGAPVTGTRHGTTGRWHRLLGHHTALRFVISGAATVPAQPAPVQTAQEPPGASSTSAASAPRDTRCFCSNCRHSTRSASAAAACLCGRATGRKSPTGAATSLHCGTQRRSLLTVARAEGFQCNNSAQQQTAHAMLAFGDSVSGTSATTLRSAATFCLAFCSAQQRPDTPRPVLVPARGAVLLDLRNGPQH